MALDRAGDPQQALVHYDAALSGELDHGLRRECLHGLGSSLRAVGRYSEAVAVLRYGKQVHPDDVEFPVFLAMAEYNDGRCKDAVTRLLRLVAGRTGGYEPAVLEYAEDLDRTW